MKINFALKNITFNTRLKLISLLVGFYWLKTITAYAIDFDLGTKGLLQYILLILNPLAISIFLFSLSLYFKRKTLFLSTLLVFYLSLNMLLIANILYYREFSDFITFSTILSASKVSAGLGDSALHLLRYWDFIYILDVIAIPIFLFKNKNNLSQNLGQLRSHLMVSALAIIIFILNVTLAEIDRPQLLKRGFSNSYIVRGLGLGVFFSNDVKETYKINKIRQNASADQLDTVEQFINQHHIAPNPDYFGIAKGRNVITIHLESFQQFLIDFHLEDDKGQKHEVSPFLNSLYHHPDTLAFSNVFHQVKAGKSSDSELLMETSLFGLNQGAFFVKYGASNTQNALPHILSKKEGYTTAAFHGNDGAFWNRNNTYKQLGYQYWFDQSYLSKPTEENSFQYGLNDKVLFADSIQYLERLQQPFYTKYITATNHYPYQHLSGKESGFPHAKTKDQTINAYFSTVNYLDTSIKLFFDYLRDSGLLENSIIVLYGDHYGISHSRNPELAELLGKDKEEWTSYDNAMLQRVPYMVHIPGSQKGGIIDTFGGLIDSAPTVQHLLGLDTQTHIQLGQDLLASNRSQVVTLRTNGTFITPLVTSYGGKLYETKTGHDINEFENPYFLEIEQAKQLSAERLNISDQIQINDLLRFYTKHNLEALEPDKISYLKAFDRLKEIEQRPVMHQQVYTIKNKEALENSLKT